MTARELRVLRALRSGPLYRPALELVLSLTETQSREATGSLMKQGFVEIATDVGPATYRLTPAGEEIEGGDDAMNESGYAVRFDFPADDPEAGSVCYAGRTADGALGFAYQLATAEVWGSETTARNFLENGYGPNMRSIGTVVRVVDGVEVTS